MVEKRVEKNGSFVVPHSLFGAAVLGAVGLLVAGLSTGCSRESSGADGDQVVAALFTEKEGEPLATVNGEVLVTVEELRERAAQQSPFLQARYETPDGRKDLLDQVVRFELLAREAARQGAHHDPDVQQALKRAMVNNLLAGRMQTFDAELVDIPEERLREYYEENISEYVTPERVRVSHVFVSAEDGAEDARARAEAALAELRSSGQDRANTFSRIVRELSDDDTTRSSGGDLTYLSKEQLEEAWGVTMAEAAFALERVGTMSDVIEGDGGFHIVRLVGRQRAKDRSLDEVRPRLLNRLRRDERNRMFEEFVTEIAQREGLVIAEDALADMGSTPPEAEEQASAPGEDD